MVLSEAYAAVSKGSPLGPYQVDRRDPGPHDVEIDVAFCGVCHSDIHQARDEWGGSTFPMVPGHEIVGRIARVGVSVSRFARGDLVGVGCMVDSCRTCAPCTRGTEQFCERTPAWTYNGTEMDRTTATYGGYATRIVVADRFVLRLPDGMDLASAAPLLCAGITTFSPLRRFRSRPGAKVGVLGLGGLGHMAVKLAVAMGAEVTVLSSSAKKAGDARRLGAHEFAPTSDEATLKRLTGRFDLLIDTVSAPHDGDLFVRMLAVNGTMVVVGVPVEPMSVRNSSLIGGNRTLAGSLIGGIAETQAMLDFCGEHGVVADIEVIPIQKINEAYERMIAGDVRYRFVIDNSSLAG